MSHDLKNRSVLITGGSRGLGAVTAERFANEGANVAVNYNSSPERAEQVCEKIRSECGVKAVALQADVGKAADCKRLVEQSIEQLGGLDIIVSNAGWTKFAPMTDLNALSEDEWDKCWAVNVKANLHLLQAAQPTFNANPSGGALLISSSVAASFPTGSSMAYSVTKSAALHMMRCMAQHLGPKIRVNAVQPGLLLTEWGEQFSKERIQAMVEKSALKSVATVEECADAFVFQAKSANMTGASIKVDGGLFC